MPAKEQPPRILQVYRERLRPGSEATYARLERDAAGARYFVFGDGKSGFLYQGADGQRFVVTPSTKVPDGPTAFAIRPEWSFPAEDWVAADPKFWRVIPSR